MKKFKNIFTLLVVALVGLQLTACSEDDLDTNPFSKSGVNLVAFGPSPILRTHEIRITGTNLNNVTEVWFPGNAVVQRSSFNSSDNENIYVNVPDESVPGQIKLLVNGDTVAKSVTPITFEEPIEISSVSPTTGLNAGDEVTVKGDYVYNIAEAIFTSGVTGAPVAAEDFTFVSRREIRFRVPLAAESGVITFNDGADWEYEYPTTLEVLSAKYNGLSTPTTDFGQQIQITGTNLHTVETVMFPGGVSADFTVSSDNKTITATVPAETKSGTMTLVLYSGASLTTDEFTVPTVTVTGASQDNDLIEGDVVVLTGENFDRIKAVHLPSVGEIKDYTISGNTLTFTVPADMTDGDVELVQNSYITTTYKVEIRKQAGIIWQGKKDLVGWDNFGVFNWDGDTWIKFQKSVSGPGTFTIGFKKLSDNPVFNFRMGDWSTPFENISIPYESDNNIHSGDATEITVTLSQAERDAMFADGGKGFVIWGDGLQVNYVKFLEATDEIDVAAFSTWEDRSACIFYPINISWSDNTGKIRIMRNTWDGAPFADGGLADLKLNVGVSKLIFYKEVGTTGQIQLNDANWKNPLTDADLTDWEGSKDVIECTFTQAMMDCVTGANSDGWSQTAFIIQGDGLKITKIAILP